MKENFQKVLSLLLAVAIVVGLAGCNSKKDKSSNTTSSDNTAQPSVADDQESTEQSAQSIEYTMDTIDDLPEAKEVYLAAALKFQLYNVFPWMRAVDENGLNSTGARTSAATIISALDYAIYINRAETGQTLTIASTTLVNNMLSRAFAGNAISGKAETLGELAAAQYSYNTVSQDFTIPVKLSETQDLPERFNIEVFDSDNVRTFIITETAPLTDGEKTAYRVVYEKGNDNKYRIVDMVSNIPPEEFEEVWMKDFTEIPTNEYLAGVIGSISGNLISINHQGDKLTITALKSSDYSVANQIAYTGASTVDISLRNGGVYLLFPSKVVILNANLGIYKEEDVPSVVRSSVSSAGESVKSSYDVTTTLSRYAYSTTEGLMMYDKGEDKVYNVYPAQTVSLSEGNSVLYTPLNPRFTSDNTRVYGIIPWKTENSSDSSLEYVYYDFVSRATGSSTESGFKLLSPLHADMGQYFNSSNAQQGVVLSSSRYMSFSIPTGAVHGIYKVGTLADGGVSEVTVISDEIPAEKVVLLEDGRVIFSYTDSSPRYFISK